VVAEGAAGQVAMQPLAASALCKGRLPAQLAGMSSSSKQQQQLGLGKGHGTGQLWSIQERRPGQGLRQQLLPRQQLQAEAGGLKLALPPPILPILRHSQRYLARLAQARKGPCLRQLQRLLRLSAT
jgi:hypothetical protein